MPKPHDQDRAQRKVQTASINRSVPLSRIVARGALVIVAVLFLAFWFALWVGSGQCDDACNIEPGLMGGIAITGMSVSLLTALLAVLSIAVDRLLYVAASILAAITVATVGVLLFSALQ